MRTLGAMSDAERRQSTRIDWRIIAAVLLLISFFPGCKSTEERIIERYQRWSQVCGYHYNAGAVIPMDDVYRYKTCLQNMEASYLAERRQNIARGAAMLRSGTALMTRPTY